MIQRVRTLTSFGRINHMRYKTLPTRCGRDKCHCLMRLDLTDKKNTKFHQSVKKACLGISFLFLFLSKILPQINPAEARNKGMLRKLVHGLIAC